MSKVGFAEVEIWEAVETISISQPEIVVPALLASTPIEPLLAELDDQSHRALTKEILLALEPYRTEDGIAVPQGAHNALARRPRATGQ